MNRSLRSLAQSLSSRPYKCLSRAKAYSTRAHWYRKLHTAKDKSVFSMHPDELHNKIAEDLGEPLDTAVMLVSKDPQWNSEQFRKWFVREIILPSAQVDMEPRQLASSIHSLSTFKRDFGIQKLMTVYNDSLLSLFEECFPEVENWMQHIPLKLLKAHDIEQRPTELADAVAQKLRIRTQKDWGNISAKELADIGVKFLADKEKRLQFLRNAYPQQQWNEDMLNRPVRASHRKLVAAIMDSLPNHNIKEETHLNLPTPHDQNDSILIDTDVYIPDLKLAVDYRGPQHFHDTRGAFMQVEGAMRKDDLKRQVFSHNGITLLEIPYWWDESLEQFQATLRQQRPDLVTASLSAEPISDTPPEKRSTSLHLMEPEFWDGKQDLSSYYVTEKLDGVRCSIRNGVLYNRKQTEMAIPSNLLEQLKNALADCPDTTFDAELVCSQSFEKLNALLTRSRQDHFREADWEDVRICLFDVVDEQKTIEERINTLHQVLEQDRVVTLKHDRLRDNDHARAMLDEVVQRGGEGLVCIRPESKYFIGRTRSMIKIKPYYDQEVLFLGKAEKSISFDVELLSGQKMKARTTWGDYRRTDLVPGETVLTICYTQTHQSTGKPFQPTVLRERKDMTWEEAKEKRREVGTDHSLLQSSMVDSFKKTFTELNIDPKQMTPKERQDFFDNHYPSQDMYPSMEEKQAVAGILGITAEEVGQCLQKMRAYRRRPPRNADIVGEDEKEEQV